MRDGEVAATSRRAPTSDFPSRWWKRIVPGAFSQRPKSAILANDHESRISIRGVCKAMGAQHILRNIDLDIDAGEFLTLLGPSGSGKTTLLMVLAGFVTPDSGAICLGENVITSLPPHQRDIGIVFQSYALFPHMNVGENIGYPLKLRRVTHPEIKRRVGKALELVRLPGFEDRSIASLSGGQRQRVAIARAIVFQPRILLMDEPLSALDKPLREAMQLELRRLHAELGLTTVYVTHDQKEALTLSDRIAVLHEGRLAEVGDPQRLYDRPTTAFVARFLGESSILEAQVCSSHVLVRGERIEANNIPAGRRHGLLIRPERLQLLSSIASAPPGMICFSGTVGDVVFQGESSRIEISLDDGASIAMRAPRISNDRQAPLVKGQRVVAGLASDDATIVVYDD
jgi:putative spermidine/putrescine transport system ATP-binding protein